MRWSERAGWKRSSGSYSYIPAEYRRRGTGGRWFWFGLKMTAMTLAIVLVGEHFAGGHSIAPQVATAAAPPPQVLTPAATEQTPTSKDKSAELNSLLSSWAAQHKSQQWGISVRQISGGDAQASYQSDQRFYPASIYKLLILETLFKKTPYSAWGKSLSNGMTITKCVDRMIRYSDNNCGVALGIYAGWTPATNQLKSLGLTNTALNTPDNQLRTSAGDVAKYLEYFYADTAYPDAKQFTLNVMSQQLYRSGIPAGSTGCTVYDKIGDLNGYKHDAGIVACPDTTYVLVVMSKGGSYAQIADIAAQAHDMLVSN